MSSAAAIIVVSHDSSAHLGHVLETTRGTAREVVVVDNASSDGSRELVTSRFPEVTLIALEENRGFGAAANVGMASVEAEYFLLVNPDAWPVGDAVEKLVAFADRHPWAGAVGPRLVGADGAEQRSIFGYPQGSLALAGWATFPSLVTGLYGTAVRLRRSLRPRASEPDGGREVNGSEFLQGSVMLLRRAAMAEVGGFDERFFLFSEEVDLSFRLRAAGWSIMLFPGATFVHLGGQSSSADPDWLYAEQVRSYVIFLEKHRDAEAADRARTILRRSLPLRALVARPKARRRFLLALESVDELSQDLLAPSG
jgi:N-acetylglucosaminyl-diphospho-decaprenol L-rhamnosyltransferase